LLPWHCKETLFFPKDTQFAQFFPKEKILFATSKKKFLNLVINVYCGFSWWQCYQIPSENWVMETQ